MRKLLRPFLLVNLYKLLDSAGLLEGINDMIRRGEEGEDPILFEAPSVIIVYYPDLGPLSLLDPTIAFTYGMLAAHSLGLGSCWIGFAIQSLHKDRPMRELLGIPADMIIAGVMTLGYPLPVYHRIPPRNNIQVQWIGGSGKNRDRTVISRNASWERDCVPPGIPNSNTLKGQQEQQRHDHKGADLDDEHPIVAPRT